MVFKIPEFHGVKVDMSRWLTEHPVDLLWRSKFEIRYASEEHKNTTFLKMAYMLIEDLEIDRQRLKYLMKEKYAGDDEMMEFFNDDVVPPSQKDIEKAFNDMDLSKYDDK